MNTAERFPLTWPTGFRRTPNHLREKSRFKSPTFGRSRDYLINEVERMGGTKIILSTNIPLKKDGMPWANPGRISDPGVAIYFDLGGKQRSLACDKWEKIEENLWALVKTVEAMRGLDRWGASDMLDRVFTGFAQLPAPSDESHRPWWEVFECDRGASIESVEQLYRKFAKANHPDNGGSEAKMAILNAAIAKAREEKSR